jgi:energy-coupling factor transporter ATP-binding protein EcfA2
MYYIKKIVFEEKYLQFNEKTETYFSEKNNIIIGNNGTGKSTIINIIYNILKNSNIDKLLCERSNITNNPFIYIGFNDENICLEITYYIMNNIIIDSFTGIGLNLNTEYVKRFIIDENLIEEFKNINQKIFIDIKENGIKINNTNYYYPLHDEIFKFIKKTKNIYLNDDNYEKYVQEIKNNYNMNFIDFYKENFGIKKYNFFDAIKHKHKYNNNLQDLDLNFHKIMLIILREIKNNVYYININDNNDYNLITNVYNDIMTNISYQLDNNSNNFNSYTNNSIKYSDLFFCKSGKIIEYSKHIECYNILKDDNLFDNVNKLYFDILGKKFKMIDDLQIENNLELPISYINIKMNDFISINYDVDDELRKIYKQKNNYKCAL